MPSDTSGVGGEPPARLEVRLLGVAEIILDGRRLRAFNSLRLQRFLALIALREGPGLALFVLCEKTVPAGTGSATRPASLWPSGVPGCWCSRSDTGPALGLIAEWAPQPAWLSLNGNRA